jgi:hypothetical protein
MSASFSISPNSGFVKGTTFSFTPDSNTLSSYNTFLWNFGDGGTSRNPNGTHVYNNAGTYNVTLNAYYNSSTYVSVTSSISIGLYLNESIYFDVIPPPTFAGHLNRYPFKVNITSSSSEPHYIDLGSQYSRSYEYQQPENNWSFLRPQWRFLDTNFNQVDGVTTIDTPIRIDNNGNLSLTGTVVGVSGTAEFYFIDDFYNLDSYLQNQPYSTIIATLQTSALKAMNKNTDDQTPSYANSYATVSMPHIFTWRDPDFINITENSIQQISKIKFTNQNIPILINFGFSSKYLPDYFTDGNGTVVASPSEFAHYIPANSSYYVPINLSAFNLSGIPLSVTYNPSPVEFIFNDSNGFDTGGYFKGTLSCAISSIDNYIQSSGYFPLIDTNSRFFNPILWISNPNAGMVATAWYFNNPNLKTVTQNYLDTAYVNAFDMPISVSYNNGVFFGFQNDGTYTDSFATSGYHGINCIAALPSPANHAWMVDSELNSIYRVNSKGDILTNINLANIAVSTVNNINPYLSINVLSPVQIAVDSQQNFWVTLYDTPNVLKFDKFGNYTLTTQFNNNIVYPTSKWWTSNTSVNDTIADEFIIRPTGIDTDLNDNIWVTYSSPFSGWLIKYDTNGNALSSHAFPLCACPQEVICDNQNNIWIVVAEDVGNAYGYLEKRDSFGNLLTAFGAYNNINHITLDVNQNPWFTYSYNWVGTISATTGVFSGLQIADGNYSDTPPNWFNPNYNADTTSLEGIASDIRNNIYVINSIENKIIVVNANTQSIVDTFQINPKGFVYTLSGALQPTQLEYNPWSKSAEATGDWSGFRWINKYAPLYYSNTANYVKDLSGNYYKYLVGNSSINYNDNSQKFFSLYSNNFYDLFKVNENFDMAGQMKSVAFQSFLQESTNLFDNFLGSIFGNAPLQHDDLGVETYEKTANYVSNQSDIDICNVNSLYDLANSVDLNTDDFRLNYPIDIQRSMDLLSINQSRIFGGQNNDFYNFNNASNNANFNRGNLLDVNTYTVSAGVPVVLKAKSLNSYKLIPTGSIDLVGNLTPLTINLSGTTSYNLNQLASSLELGQNWNLYYEFYSFVPMTNTVITDNVVDWNHTNLNRNDLLSFFINGSAGLPFPDSYLNWASNEGIMEFIFTYQLYKGLGLI